jgi:hypothetical protein
VVNVVNIKYGHYLVKNINISTIYGDNISYDYIITTWQDKNLTIQIKIYNHAIEVSSPFKAVT